METAVPAEGNDIEFTKSQRKKMTAKLASMAEAGKEDSPYFRAHVKRLWNSFGPNGPRSSPQLDQLKDYGFPGYGYPHTWPTGYECVHAS